jgi:uncharacterized phage protein (TIGR01671 family)
MRQLKFRIWDKLQKQYTYSTDWAARHYWITLSGQVQNMQNGAGSPELVIQQWTGLQDKDGKEIYEGDLVKTENADRKNYDERFLSVNSEVYYNKNTASFRTNWTNAPKTIYLVGELALPYSGATNKVVGNIFQNPELTQN